MRVDARIKSGHEAVRESEAFLQSPPGLTRWSRLWQHSSMKRGYVYIMTNQRSGTLYIGVTSDLARRVHEHREGLVAGFTKLYGLNRLVHVEIYDDIKIALQREKTMKHWSRRWKIEAIETVNPDWRDLFDEIV